MTVENHPPEEDKKRKPMLPFFPNYMLDEFIAWYILLAILVVLSSLFPAGIEEQADAFRTPAHAKPEWYFLSLYQLLKWVPRLAGVGALAVGAVVLFLLPFIDRSPQKSWRKRPIAIVLGTVVFALIIILTVWGWNS